MPPDLMKMSLRCLCCAYIALTLAAGARLRSSKANEDVSSGSDASVPQAYLFLEAELNVSAAGRPTSYSSSAAAAHLAGQVVQHKVLQREVADLLEDSLGMNCTSRPAALTGSRAAQVIDPSGYSGTSGNCLHMLSRAKHIVEHQEQLASTFSVYEGFVMRTTSKVLGWEINAAHPDSTDKVAVIVLTQGLEDSYMPHNVEYVVRSVAKRLGPHWALQIFYGEGQQADLARVLGDPKNVIWTRAVVDGKDAFGRAAYNRLRWSRDFYGAIDARHEHILIFELDSMLLVSDCAGRPEFLKYDMVGAPGTRPHFPEHFVNGGFTLRKRSTLLRAVGARSRREAVRLAGNNPDEDNVAVYNLLAMNASIAPEDVAVRFSLEQIPSMPACGFHKPWVYSNISPSFFRQVLDSATYTI